MQPKRLAPPTVADIAAFPADAAPVREHLERAKGTL